MTNVDSKTQIDTNVKNMIDPLITMAKNVAENRVKEMDEQINDVKEKITETKNKKKELENEINNRKKTNKQLQNEIETIKEEIEEISKKKTVSELTLEELQSEMEKINKIKEDLKFVTPITGEQFKYLQLFLTKKAKWEGINAFAVYNLGTEIHQMHDASAKTFTFTHDQLEAIRFLLQKFGSEGLEDAKMFVSIMRLINIPLQEASALAMHESEVSNHLQAKMQGIDMDTDILNMTDVMKESANLPEIPEEKN